MERARRSAAAGLVEAINVSALDHAATRRHCQRSGGEIEWSRCRPPMPAAIQAATAPAASEAAVMNPMITALTRARRAACFASATVCVTDHQRPPLQGRSDETNRTRCARSVGTMSERLFRHDDAPGLGARIGIGLFGAPVDPNRRSISTR